MTFRSISSATLSTFLATFLAALVGCWSGATSQGLPCESNEHCGLGLQCVNGFCGGEPSDELCGNGWVDPNEECDEGSRNADNGACKLDCTAARCGDGSIAPGEQCDDGEQNDNNGACKLDCTPASCGDGFVGPGEQCDYANDPDDLCTSMCMAKLCGNGIIDPGEDCDDGDESASCDDDCTAVACGDGYFNQAAGEGCDDGNTTDDFTCMANCTVPLLWDDMEAATPVVEWTHMKVSGEDEVTSAWMVNARNGKDGGRSWDSGLPPDGYGDTRLMTPTLDLGGLTGETISLRFDHARQFTDCGDQLAYEGAVIEVAVDGGAFEIVTPDDGYSGPVYADLCTDNPLIGVEAFTRDSFYTSERVDLSEFVGRSIQIGFRVGWDCGNCPDDQTGRGWFIDNVVVAIE